jgi:hypothetical protein
MELIDRYLKAVGSYLPAEQRDDITKELSENIRSEIEDGEAELGRPLTGAEQEAILKKQGHPLLVAGRYRQDRRSVAFGRQWIGPVIFPFYIKVLTFNLGISFTVVTMVFVALYASGQAITFSDVAFAYSLQLIAQFGIVTGIFAMVEKHLTKYPDRWDPRKPNQLKYPEFFEAKAAKKGQRVPKLESISQFIASAVFLVWLRAAQKSPFLIFGPAAAIFRLAPVWHQMFVPSMLIILLGMVQAAINLLRPDWVRFRSAVRVGIGVITLVVVYFLVKAREWVVLASPAGNVSGDYRHAMEIVNQTISYSLLAAGVIVIVLLLRDVWRLVRRPEHGAVASRA